jgi:hypothetical protein
MSVATMATTAGAGRRMVLGRYRIVHGERILIGRRVLGVVRISDIPAGDRGRRYLVERELTRKVELDARVADYLSYARVHADCPMRVPAVDYMEGSR